jgi:hypothetical protein
MESKLLQQLQQLSTDPSFLAIPASSSVSSTSRPASITEGSFFGSSLTAASSPLASEDEVEAPCCEVRHTPDRGQALYSTRRIRPGTLILTEGPLIALSKELEESYDAIEDAFAKLSKREKKTYLSLFDAQKSRMSAVVSIYYSNCYSTEPFFPADSTASRHTTSSSPNPSGARSQLVTAPNGSCIGALASRINHSCIPNVSFSFIPPSTAHPKGQMRFYAIKAISKGKELLSNYDKNIFEGAAKRQQKYRLHYGFDCACEACVPRTEFWARSDERRRGMKEVVGEVKVLEREWLGVEVDSSVGKELCRKAMAVLLRLEGLLMKEGLVAAPLANVYRSLGKWSERAGYDARQWKEKELDVSLLVFGARGVRTVALRADLEDCP